MKTVHPTQLIEENLCSHAYCAMSRPFLGCSYVTDDLDAHIATHALDAASGAAVAKIEKVKRPTTSAAGSSEEWA